MTQYAYYDHTAQQPSRVLGWFDDDTGGTAPPVDDLTPISDPALWAARYSAVYYVSNGVVSTNGPGPALSTVQNQQITTLTAACALAVTGGYISNALGAAYHYPSDQGSQQNMAACVISTLLPGADPATPQPFWCQNTVSSTWTMANHTAAQIQQAGKDAKAMIQGAQVKLANLSVQVYAANTVAAVQAITWA